VLIRKHTRKIRAWLARRPDQKTARYTCDGLLRRRNGLKLGLIVVEIQSQEVGLYTDLQSSQEDLGRHPLEKKPTKMAFIISKNEKNGGETITYPAMITRLALKLSKMIRFDTLVWCGDEAWIENEGQIYSLRRTKQGKLLWTK
jgi:hemin uptake protein HemP